MKRLRHNPLSNKKGFAVIESVVILFVFLILFWYSIGFFGVTHSAIHNSMASRNYAFETFRHRSHLWWFRSNSPSDLSYHDFGSRLHGTNSDMTMGANLQYATERRIAMFKGETEPEGRTSAAHNQAMGSIATGERNSSISLDPVWIKVQYGICLTAECTN